jgi:Holliday junction resolvase
VSHPSKRKGSDFEREIVRFLQDNGIAAAERVPLSGAAGGSYTGDIDVPVRGVDRKLECKRRARAFGTLYKYMGNNFALVLRDNHTEPLVLMRLKDFVELARSP